MALTYTPLSPLDALSELIDNGIDALRVAALRGDPVQHPLIAIQLPGKAEVQRGEGWIRVQDNGPGMSPEEARAAITAGYSSHNPYDSLGLFGMGFNISSGKLGRRTRLLTARKQDKDALEVMIDLPEMQQSRSYNVPDQYIPKPEGFSHGTLVEISHWWPAGHKNRGVIEQLSNYGQPVIRRELGRRYATLIRSGVRLTVNKNAVDAHEHCVWNRSRYVERRGGQIPAMTDINEVLANQTRCSECYALIADGMDKCPECGSSSFRTIEERVKGWIGIQRFDNETNFGIDVIRNGRAILVGEKNAFFEWENEFRTETVKDYPIDQPYGRIVGELHLDHVPVDFMKQDFIRASEEWIRAMEHVRGKSSLQPNQPGADTNTSPLFKLYQGYRKIRTPGRADMYMGYWDEEAGKPKRISRQIERELYEKFKANVPGYRDDSEWWKYVESADQAPPDPLFECPECGAENLMTSEVCAVCEHILSGKACINTECDETLPLSAVVCPKCETSQIPDIEEPWKCNICGTVNREDDDWCSECTRPRNTPPPGSREYLESVSNRSDELSLPGASVELADGSHSAPIDVNVWVATNPIVPVYGKPSVPLLSFRAESIDVFVDTTHLLFRAYRMRPEYAVASELSQYLYDQNRSLLTQNLFGLHSMSALTTRVLGLYSDTLEDSVERIRADINRLFENIRGALSTLVDSARAQQIYADFTESDQRSLVSNIIGMGQDPSRLGEWKLSGEYLKYVSPKTIVKVFDDCPGLFFDGSVWNVSYADIGGLDEPVLSEVREELSEKYLNCLEDCAAFLHYSMPEPLTSYRSRSSIDFLSTKLA